ncbi:tensin-4-like [Schistocerca americana]|uniref:tensin-4-like n=1 Tax=Schistocerca americana TaxID=7009 RepID=UPI001F4F6C23|nr:tensin-4-like [Schistocerca americana]
MEAPQPQVQPQAQVPRPAHMPAPLEHGAASSDEDNSPTELNSCRRLADKPPLVKRLTMGAGVVIDLDVSFPLKKDKRELEVAWLDGKGGHKEKEIQEHEIALEGRYLRRPVQYPSFHSVTSSPKRPCATSRSGSVCPCHADCTPDKGTPATSPRHQPLEMREPWFRTGMPRETALEVLDHEPEGAFMVRESTSKPGCYALSLRVPRDFQPSGIAHYLILRTAKGYKIKGFTKEFSSLASLITHHSVMPELLPVPLALSRYRPALGKSDSSRDFSDGDCDRDYNTLADLRQMLAELKM